MKQPIATAFVALVLATASLTGQNPPAFQTPAMALSAALADCQANIALAPTLRYLWFGNIPDADRPDMIATVNFTLNALSRRRIISQAAVLDGSLMRVNLSDYAIDPEAWTEFGTKGSGPVRSAQGTDCPEPYFHHTARLTTQAFEEKLVDVPAYRGSDGKTYNQRWDKVPGAKKTSEQLVYGPWLPASEVAALALAAGTDFPILRADWFVANALLPPAYQKFIGAKTLKDFDATVRYRGSDDDLATRGAIVFSQEVAIHNRALLRTPTVLGPYWQSIDFLSSTGDQDVLQNVFNRKADAREIIAAAPNGMHHYLIVNGQDKVIDAADANIAIDRSTSWDNKLVYTGFSCMVCHNQGIKSFKDDIRGLADRRKNIFAIVRQGKDAQQFLDLFGPDISQNVVADQAAFARAMLAANGRTPQQNSAALSKAFLRHVQQPVTLDMAAMELGFPKDRIVAILKTAQGLDHSLVQLLADLPIRRDQWEHSGYGQLATLLSVTK